MFHPPCKGEGEQEEPSLPSVLLDNVPLLCWWGFQHIPDPWFSRLGPEEFTA